MEKGDEYKMEMVKTVNDNIDIKINYKKNIKNILIAIHGFGGSSNSSTIKFLKDNLVDDLAVVSFDLPNHGKNKTDKPLVLKECIDCIKQVDEYVKREYKGSKISYFASSFGGYCLLNFLSNTKYKYENIFLRAPAVNMDKVIQKTLIGDEFEKLKDSIVDLGGIKIDDNFYKEIIENKLIEIYNNNHFLNVFQGKKDEIVNYKDNDHFFSNKCANNYKIYYFENSKHSFKSNEELKELINKMKNIIKR